MNSRKCLTCHTLFDLESNKAAICPCCGAHGTQIVVEPDVPASGYKDDHGKLRMDLVPPEAVQSIARVLTYGATGKPYRPDCPGKPNPYPERNWERGMDLGRVFAALQRHAWAWWAKEPYDAESGLSHLEHVLCCAAFLVTFEKRSLGEDTRVKAISDAEFERMLRATLVDAGLIAPETAAEIARTEQVFMVDCGCPHCGTIFPVETSSSGPFAGQPAECPQCRQSFLVEKWAVSKPYGTGVTE